MEMDRIKGKRQKNFDELVERTWINP